MLIVYTLRNPFVSCFAMVAIFCCINFSVFRRRRALSLAKLFMLAFAWHVLNHFFVIVHRVCEGEVLLARECESWRRRRKDDERSDRVIV